MRGTMRMKTRQEGTKRKRWRGRKGDGEEKGGRREGGDLYLNPWYMRKVALHAL